VFLLVPAHPGSPGQRAVKRLLLLLLFNVLLLLHPWERLRSIVMSRSICRTAGLSVCVYVCLSVRISPEPQVRSLPNFSCMLPVSVARSSSGVFVIGRIAYQREGVFFPLKMNNHLGKGDESAQRGQSMLSTIALLHFA